MSEHPHKRLRLSKACTSCRRLKKKCDSAIPCSTCVRFKHECEYEEQVRPSPQQGGHTVIRKSISTPNDHAITNGVRNGVSSVTSSTKHDFSILDPERGRYFDTSSAVAFPRLLGIEFGASKAPRLHSFGWNLGLRNDVLTNALDITKVIPLDDVYVYSNEYFLAVHPYFEILNQQAFIQRVSLRWKKTAPFSPDDLNYDAVISGVVVLGYFCAQRPDDGAENALVSFAKDRLENAGLSRPPTTDIIAAWILRTIYLRATSRPHSSWMASNITMHSIQASGIYHEISSIDIIYPSIKCANVEESEIQYRRKVFWVGRALNAIFSYEYSRPRVNLERISCERIDSSVDIGTRQILEMAELIPDDTKTSDEETEIVNTRAMLHHLTTFTKFKGLVSLLCAEMAFAAYRHLRPFLSTGTVNCHDIEYLLLSINTAALDAINTHLDHKPTAIASPSFTGTEQAITPWWCLLTVPFQMILILLSLDTSECLAQLSPALQALQKVAATFDTHMTRESVQTAAMLIRLSQGRKQKDMNALSNVLKQLPDTRSMSSARPNTKTVKTTVVNMDAESNSIVSNRNDSNNSTGQKFSPHVDLAQQQQNQQQSMNNTVGMDSMTAPPFYAPFPWDEEMPMGGGGGDDSGNDHMMGVNNVNGDGRTILDQIMSQTTPIDWDSLFDTANWI